MYVRSLTFGNLLVEVKRLAADEQHLFYTMTLSECDHSSGGALLQMLQVTRRARDPAWDNIITTIPPTRARGGSWRLRRKRTGNYAGAEHL